MPLDGFELAICALALGLLPVMVGAAQGPGPAAEGAPPAGAVVLFDGKDTSAWRSARAGRPVGWQVVDGTLVVAPGTGDIVTRRKFGDCRVHLEFALSDRAPGARPTTSSNSGIKLHRIYEIQIIDSVGVARPGVHDCGALYRQKAPDRNVCKAPGEWQTYDIVFRAPRLDAAGAVTQKPRISVVWNGVTVHDDVEIAGPTSAGSTAPMVATDAMLLQDHGAPVRFRSIWVQPLKLDEPHARWNAR